jgi:hypothetical protein
MNIFNNILKKVMNSEREIFLVSTSLASDLDKQLKFIDPSLPDRYFFEYMYSKPNSVKKITTVINAVFTQKRQTFMLSRDFCVDLIKNDQNHGLSLGNKEYSKLLFNITNCGLFEKLKEPTNRKAGVYKLVEPQLVLELHKLAAKEFFQAQEELVLDYYENITKTITDKTTTPAKAPKLKSAKDIIEETNARLASKDIQ